MSLILTALAAAGATERVEPLGAMGEIPVWLALGYLPIPAAVADREATLDRDLLAASGGEAACAPTGGQAVASAGARFVWSRAPLVPPTLMQLYPRPASLPLFDAPGGGVLENTAVYLACTLRSTHAQTVRLLLGSDDSVKVVLNGAVVHRFVGARSMLEDSDTVALELRAGDNRLLVRVDNYANNGGFVGRLADEAGLPARGVAAVLALSAETPDWPQPRATPKLWRDVVAEIPPLAPAADETRFGARLPRTLALLESGDLTGRPIRILFFGQSITAQEWTRLLIEQLRERYPGATIEAENHALGGWTMPVLMRTLGHSVLRNRPDLVVFHVYGGDFDQWDRVLSDIRRETGAEIVMRSPHPQLYSSPAHEHDLDNQERLLRALAARHGAEYVECRREWKDYLTASGQSVSNFLTDAIHLNRHGNVLMAQLYARHFKTVPGSGGDGWARQERWHGARRAFEDRRDDGVRLTGAWRVGAGCVTTTASGAVARLEFVGNRVDAALAPGAGVAQIRIDGLPAGALNLFRGTLPKQDGHARTTPVLRRYFLGSDVQAERWTLTVTARTADWQRFRFRLDGSLTGADGTGESGHDFRSTSGRIHFFADDLIAQVRPADLAAPAEPAVWLEVPQGPSITWQTLPTTCDEVCASAGGGLRWLTLADGLPFGKHVIELVAQGGAPFNLVGFETYVPPLAARTEP